MTNFTSFLKSFFKFVDRAVYQIEEKVIALSIIMMALVLILNIFMRALNSSFPPAEELSQFLIFFVTFLGTSYAARMGMHIRMSLLSDILKGNPQKILAIFVSLTTCLIMFYVTYLSLKYVLKVGAQNRVSPILQWPIMYIYLVMPLGFFLTGIQYFLTFTRNLMSPGAWISFAIQFENNMGLASGTTADSKEIES